MGSKELGTLYAHARWANHRVLDAADLLSSEEFRAAEHPSFGSIRNAFVHVVDVQRTWLARAQALDTPPVLDPKGFPDVAALRELWDRVDAETDAYIAGVDEAALDETVRYVNDRGEPNAYPRWQILVHQTTHAGTRTLNTNTHSPRWQILVHQTTHAAQHRSELALLLTRLGQSPGWLDLLVFVDDRGAERRAV